MIQGPGKDQEQRTVYDREGLLMCARLSGRCQEGKERGGETPLSSASNHRTSPPSSLLLTRRNLGVTMLDLLSGSGVCLGGEHDAVA